MYWVKVQIVMRKLRTCQHRTISVISYRHKWSRHHNQTCTVCGPSSALWETTKIFGKIDCEHCHIRPNLCPWSLSWHIRCL